MKRILLAILSDWKGDNIEVDFSIYGEEAFSFVLPENGPLLPEGTCVTFFEHEIMLRFLVRYNAPIYHPENETYIFPVTFDFGEDMSKEDQLKIIYRHFQEKWLPCNPNLLN